MSFRQFGGLNYAPKHNIVASNYNTSNNLLVTQNVGQSNSYINYLSDISGNIRIYGDFDVSGNITANYMFLSSYPPNFSNQPNAVMPKAYIDAFSGGVVPFGAVKAISTFDSSSNNSTGYYPVPLTSQTSIGVIDGYTPSVGDLILLNDQGSNDGQNPATLNGIYQLTGGPGNYLYVRSSIMPDTTDVKSAGVNVQQGIANERGVWVQTQDPAIVGNDLLLWTIFFSFNYSLGQGLSIANAPNNKEVLFVDSSLNFLTLVDASSSYPNLNIGTENATTINVSKNNGQVNIYVPDTLYNVIENQSGFQINTDVNAVLYFGTSDSGNYSYLQSIKRGIGTNNLLFNARGGNVGIGTNNPSYTLDVSGNITSNGIICRDYANNPPQSYINIASQSGANYIETFGNSLSGGSSAPLFFTNGYAANTYMSIVPNSGGGTAKIGIGTINPSYSLDVNGNTHIGGTSTNTYTTNLLVTDLTTTPGPMQITGTSGSATVSVLNNSSGSMVLNYNNSGGSSSILFPSTTPLNGDFGYIQYFENVPYTSSTGSEAGLFLIGVEGDATVSSGIDRISLYSCGGSGYVGVNTIYPNYSLDVSGNINFTGTLYQNGQAFSSNSQWTTINSSEIYFNNNGTGKVGIGTNSPGFTLDVRGATTTNSVLNVTNTSPLSTTTGSYISLSSFNNTSGGNNVMLNTYLYRYTGNSSTGWQTVSCRIQNEVDVTYKGYIEFNPSTLDGTSYIDGGIAIKGYNSASIPPATTNGGLIVNGSGSVLIPPNTNLVPYFQSYTDLINNYLYFQKTVGGIYDLGLQIGSSSVWNIYGDGSASFIGNVSAASFNTTSDYRIKDNIQILNESYTVDNLRAITYYNKKTEKQDIGLLAHEVQEHYPCLVNGEKDAEELQTVNYTGLIPILIKEIQELKKEIKLLKEKI